MATPFAWIYYEEWDDESTNSSRIATALKYTIGIGITLALLFALGLFVPSASGIPKDKTGLNLGYLKDLIASSRPTKALLFVLGILLCAGTLTAIYYSSTGLGTLPMSLLKTKSSRDLDAEEGDQAVELELNQQKQRQIQLRYESNQTHMPPKERRELESLQRRERALVRSIRLKSQGRSQFLERASRPVNIFFGLLYLFLSLVFIATLTIGLIRELLSKDSCGPRCGFLKVLPSSILLNPIDLVMTKLPYYGSFILGSLFILFLTLATLHGIKSLGIRFLWISLFKVRADATVPQALLTYGLSTLFAVLGLQYTFTNFVAPAYVQYGTQTFCNATLAECAENQNLVVPCTLLTNEEDSKCTRSVISRIGASLVTNFPGFGIVLYWAQYAILGVFLFSLVVSVFKKNLGYHLPGEEDDNDSEDELDGTRNVNERTRLVQ